MKLCSQSKFRANTAYRQGKKENPGFLQGETRGVFCLIFRGAANRSEYQEF